MKWIASSLSVVAMASGSAAADSLFVTTSGPLQATAQIGSSTFMNATVPFTYPGPGSTQASVSNGLVTSDVSYLFEEAATQSIARVSFAHHCAFSSAPSFGRAFLYSGATFEGVPGTPYTLSGTFSVDFGMPQAELHFDVSLIANPGGVVFRHSTVRVVSGGSAIVLGAPVQGDVLIGTTTGTIAPNTSYLYAATIYTVGMSSLPGGSNSHGKLVVSLGGPPCYANCDQSTAAPVLNVNDFQCFLNLFAIGSSAANCDQSTSPPILNIIDFLCFMNAYASGCT
ncbi:MAG: GC-type dockerin domain-anchored protein [Phycisphaerales bacterium]